MADFVAEYPGKLSFIFDPEQQPAPHLHGAVGGHGGIKVGDLDQIDAYVLAVFWGKTANNRLQVRIEFRIANQMA